MRYVLAALGTAAFVILAVPAVHASPVDAAAQSLTNGQVAYAKKGGWHGGGKGWKHGWKGHLTSAPRRRAQPARRCSATPALWVWRVSSRSASRAATGPAGARRG